MTFYLHNPRDAIVTNFSFRASSYKRKVIVDNKATFVHLSTAICLLLYILKLGVLFMASAIVDSWHMKNFAKRVT